jgi:hypothetical protein
MLHAFVDHDSSLDVEIRIFARNMKREVVGVIDSFLSSLTKYDKKRVHNMLALMLDLKFKSLRLISYFIGCELEVAIVIKYDKKLLFLMFLKFLFASIPETKSSFVITYDEDNNLNNFEMVVCISELAEKLTNRKLMIFHKF